MKEEYVTYEQAILLKKLGFKSIGCFYNYDIVGNLTPNVCSSPNNEVITSIDLIESHNFWEHERVDAPTLAQVQKWLREEKGLYLVWDMGQDRKNNSKFAWYVNDIHGYIVNDLASEIIFNTPEEALSAGITECLKLLENENN